MPRRTAAATTAAPLVPPDPTLESLRAAAAPCQACDLWKTGTQTVFGQGNAAARLMFVGEGPGSQEDLQGRPFVGPAGRLLDQALERAGISRGEVYITNVVKHFKWNAEGQRRVPAKPAAIEIAACKPWLDAEINLVRPAIIVCLGAVAAQALLGKDFRLTRQRGEFVQSPLARYVTATLHPAAILRIPNPGARQEQTERFFEEMKTVAAMLEEAAQPRVEASEDWDYAESSRQG